ncbi:MAG: hypothetical protein LBB77_02485, partial [Treponema sp.]|nr:hypothetical protein [Treponema sp.]
MKKMPGYAFFQFRNPCFWKKPSLFLSALFLLAALSGCDLFNSPLVDYFLDNTGIVEVLEVVEKPPVYYKMASGTILIPPGSTTIDMSLYNPRNLNFRHQFLGETPAGRIMSAERVESNKLEVTVAGAEEGDEYDLTLAMQSPDGLRDFAPHA